jgi:hypothetical protein
LKQVFESENKIAYLNFFQSLHQVCAHAHAGHTHAVNQIAVLVVCPGFVYLFKTVTVDKNAAPNPLLHLPLAVMHKRGCGITGIMYSLCCFSIKQFLAPLINESRSLIGGFFNDTIFYPVTM